MPLYEYECEVCGKRFERIHKFSDPPIAVCVHCGKSPVRKLFSSPAIQFKGSGFYITDYAKAKDPTSTKDSKEPTESKESKDSKDSKSSESKSTETKSTESKSSETKSTDTATKKD